MKALIFLADGFEELSLYVPWSRLREEGIAVTIASPLMHALTGLHGYTVEPNARIHELNLSDFDLLVLPDGTCAEKLRLREAAVVATRTFIHEGSVAAIGHGPQVLLSAGALDGRTVTCSPGIRDDVRAAGALYRDEPAIVDGNLLTGRSCDDLPEFCKQMMRFVRSVSTR
jgi:protease I